MLDQKHSHIKMVTHETDGIHQLCGLVRVHAGCRLVQEKKLRVRSKGAGDFQLSLLTIRQVGCLVITFLIQIKDL